MSSCQEGNRYLYKLSDKEKTLILNCDERSSKWTDASKLEWNDSAIHDNLESLFNVKDIEDFFLEDCSGYATKEDIEGTQWENVSGLIKEGFKSLTIK